MKTKLSDPLANQVESPPRLTSAQHVDMMLEDQSATGASSLRKAWRDAFLSVLSSGSLECRAERVADRAVLRMQARGMLPGVRS